jgi:tetratricopeptide (TPR) repeat protein
VEDLNAAAKINHRHNWLGSWTAAPYPLGDDHVESLRLLDQFVKQAPRSAWALAWRGETRLQAGDVEGGLDDLNAALRLSPGMAWAYAWRGEARLKLGEFKKAMTDLNEAARRDPEYGRSYAWRGRLHQLEGRHRSAVEDFNRAVGDSLIEYSWLYHWRSNSYAALKKNELARADARAALSLEPHRAEFQEAAAR